MATEQQRGPQTRSHAETQRADFDAYFASEEFESLVNKAVSTEFTRFISSEEFKNMFTITTKSIITQVVSDVVINEIEEATKPLQHQIDSLKDELNKAQIHINHNEQYSRRCNIRIFGIQEMEGENCSEVVLNFLKKELGLAIAFEDIDRCHRLGPSRGDGLRAIIVKFVSYRVKSEVLRSRKKLKGKKLYIYEDLAATNMMLLRESRDRFRGYSVWTADGKVLVKFTDGKITRIQSKKDIDELMKCTPHMN